MGSRTFILDVSDGHDTYFARGDVFPAYRGSRRSRLASLPACHPCQVPAACVIGYVLESRIARRGMHTFEDGIIEARMLVPGGRPTIPASAAPPCIKCCSIRPGSTTTHSRGAGAERSDGQQCQYRRRLLFAGRAVLLRSCLGLLRNTDDIGDVVVGSQNGVPVRVKDIANVEIGHAPRLGEFGFMKKDDAVEGVT